MNIDTIRKSNLHKVDNMINDSDGIDVKFSSKWVEHEAVDYLKSELNKYKGIFDTSSITTKDKGISYDGVIEIMNNASENSNEWIGKIDVQVKGTCVDRIKSGKSKFCIDVKHLQNYVRHPLGVLFFVIQIEKTSLKKKIFYRYLLPVDLYKIFETITNQRHKNIDVYPICPEQKNMLKNKCLQFIKARDMQVGKRIVVLDDKTQPIELMVQDFRENEKEYLKDKVYVYAKLNEDEGLIPAIISNNGRFGAVNLIEQPVIVNGKKYYESVEEIIEEDTILYKYSENVIFDKNKRTFTFIYRGTIQEIINNMKFALALMKNYDCDGKDKISLLEYRLKILNRLSNNLKKLNITQECEFEGLTELDYKNMEYFNKLMDNDDEAIRNFGESRLYILKISNKNIVLLICKNEKGVTIHNFFDNISNKMAIMVKIEEQFIKICPYCTLIDCLNFEDIFNFDKESVGLSIQNSDCNIVNKQWMNLLTLSLINSYDRTNDERFYKLAKELIDKLIDWEPKDNVYIINKMQLIKRKRNFSSEETETLQNIKISNSDNIDLLYAISILLENKSDIDWYYEKMDEKTKLEFSKYPIEKLRKV